RPHHRARLRAPPQATPFSLAALVTLLMERGALTPAVGANAAGRWQLAAGSLRSRRLSPGPAAVPPGATRALPPAGPLPPRHLAAVLPARSGALSAEPRSVLRDAPVPGTTVRSGGLEALE